jgi:NAD(P)-dependent dehydrogenase (short-subunit alcohol dehydrogenase family)
MFDANLNSAFPILRAVIPPMRKAGGGRVIAIGSRAAEDPGPKVGAYSASKAARLSLIRTVALENKDASITANVILPGTMDTPPNRRDMPGADVSQWVQPASVASLIWGWQETLAKMSPKPEFPFTGAGSRGWRRVQ